MASSPSTDQSAQTPPHDPQISRRSRQFGATGSFILLLSAALFGSGCGGSSDGPKVAFAGAANTPLHIAGDAPCANPTDCTEPVAPPGMIAVRRFWREEERDWVTVGSESTDEQLRSWGYVDRHLQLFVPASPGEGTVAVYRWYSAADEDWVTFRDGDPADATIAGWGYTNKTFSFHAYESAGPDRVEVNRWWSEKDRDWVTLAATEIPETTLRSWGYTNKHFLFYAKPR